MQSNLIKFIPFFSQILILPVAGRFVKVDRIFFGYNFSTKEIFLLWVSQILSVLVFVNLMKINKFKKLIIKDRNHKDFNIFSVGGGSFAQYFRDNNINLKTGKETNEEILELIEQSVYKNFTKYLLSDEFKDDKILIPLIQSINSLPGNKTFEKMNFNIIVFEEKNETIRIIEPIGKFQLKENLDAIEAFYPIDVSTNELENIYIDYMQN